MSWSSFEPSAQLRNHTCRPCFGALKATPLATKEECKRFLSHLLTEDVLRSHSERLAKKAGEKYAKTTQGLGLGAAAQDVTAGRKAVRFAVAVRRSDSQCMLVCIVYLFATSVIRAAHG